MRFVMALTITSALLASGCIRPAIAPTLRYTLNPEMVIDKAEPAGRSLGIRPLRASTAYKQPMVYLEGLKLGEFSRSEWVVQPADMVTRAIIDAILATGRFQDVGNASDMQRSDLLLVGSLRRFEVDKNTERWEAICEVRLEMRKTFEPGLVWGSTIRATAPLDKNTAAAFPDAMNKALAMAAQQAAKEIGEI